VKIPNKSLGGQRGAVALIIAVIFLVIIVAAGGIWVMSKLIRAMNHAQAAVEAQASNDMKLILSGALQDYMQATGDTNAHAQGSYVAVPIAPNASPTILLQSSTDLVVWRIEMATTLPYEAESALEAAVTNRATDSLPQQQFFRLRVE